jgi:anti-sigma regulatory factor (Ser/Thr protein kinase)
MPDGTNRRASLDLRGASASVAAQVRRWTSNTLTGIGDAHLGDVLMVVTELVTNAYEHGRGALEVRMGHARAPCRVRIEVDDSCLDHPVVAAPSQTTPGGRGMLMVEKLAVGWGVQEHRGTGGKTVWADVACDGDDAEPCAS